MNVARLKELLAKFPDESEVLIQNPQSINDGAEWDDYIQIDTVSLEKGPKGPGGVVLAPEEPTPSDEE